ncbi:NADPH-dependent 2,4-dienoyl-CoA reductase/sulfur reductase-like enzyme [Amycolatopsis lexingtonensis]|uniref:NADPH-dependent 2,4-dienoyl-CoA reductase/sulfur reductase-like enzyme n=1 Tax=Amycolatopsis lexingtonensis TaxID=218822 RepID=A0ABR9HUN0_9PSEU|nr:FAD-dependent oxidoreductase [Amycolatopsis lexingtonensis]MBE1494622.1 NADPH-dependent 2,4-dienoyl-CoA reductase/sulfur reductase-like enzyme [Amycolatopsis lexingtonensis]
MDAETLLVVGSGPAGVSAARAYREAGGAGPVRLLSADADPPYERPPLSKEFLRGEADLPPLDDSLADLDITVTLGDPVTELGDGRVRTAAGAVHPFTTCVLATGAEPVRPELPGADHPDVRTLRSAADSRELRAAATGVRSAIVVGAGFIGCEAAVSLSRLGLQVTVVCPDDVPQEKRLGREAGRFLLRWLKSEGVSVLRGTKLLSVEGGHRVRTDLVPVLDAGLVVLATGIRPRIELAEAAGLAVERSRIRTDEHLRTSRDGVLAAGDVALAHNPAAGRALAVEHWGEGLAMGEVAGRTAAGEDATWDAVPGFWSVVGERVLKYAAWGDGFDRAHAFPRDDGGFTFWYERDGRAVGVLTHEADEDYERGADLIRRGAPVPVS